MANSNFYQKVNGTYYDLNTLMASKEELSTLSSLFTNPYKNRTDTEYYSGSTRLVIPYGLNDLVYSEDWRLSTLEDYYQYNSASGSWEKIKYLAKGCLPTSKNCIFKSSTGGATITLKTTDTTLTITNSLNSSENKTLYTSNFRDNTIPKFLFIAIQAGGGGGGAGWDATSSYSSSWGSGAKDLDGQGGAGGGFAAAVVKIDRNTTYTISLGTAGQGGYVKSDLSGVVEGTAGGNTTLKRGSTTLLTATGGNGGVADFGYWKGDGPYGGKGTCNNTTYCKCVTLGEGGMGGITRDSSRGGQASVPTCSFTEIPLFTDFFPTTDDRYWVFHKVYGSATGASGGLGQPGGGGASAMGKGGNGGSANNTSNPAENGGIGAGGGGGRWYLGKNKHKKGGNGGPGGVEIWY